MKYALASLAALVLLAAPLATAQAAQDFNSSRSNKERGLAAPADKIKAAGKQAAQDFNVSKSNKDRGRMALSDETAGVLKDAKCATSRRAKYGQCMIFGLATPGATLTKAECAVARVKYGQCWVFSSVTAGRAERIKKGTNMLLPSICTEKRQLPEGTQCWVFSDKVAPATSSVR